MQAEAVEGVLGPEAEWRLKLAGQETQALWRMRRSWTCWRGLWTKAENNQILIMAFPLK